MELTIVLIQINIHMIVMFYSVISCYLYKTQMNLCS